MATLRIIYAWSGEREVVSAELTCEVEPGVLIVYDIDLDELLQPSEFAWVN